jgi:hypothetical protein
MRYPRIAGAQMPRSNLKAETTPATYFSTPVSSLAAQYAPFHSLPSGHANANDVASGAREVGILQ